MKKAQILSILVVTLFLFSITVNAKDKKGKKEVTVEDVMDSYIEAIGGKEALDKLKDFTITQKVTVPGGEIKTVTKQINEEDRFLVMIETYMNDMLVRKTISTPDTFTFIAPQGTQKVAGIQAKVLNQTASLVIEQSYPVTGIKPVLIGTEKINGKTLHHVAATYGSGATFHSYYDAETGLKTYIGVPSGDEGSVTEATDYQKMGDTVMFPFKMVNPDNTTKNITITEVTDVIVNQGLKAEDLK
mgnify:CR=1 FL=1